MTNYERIYDRDDPAKVLARMVGGNPLWKGTNVVLVDEDEGSQWYWGMFPDDKFHGMDSLLSDLMDTSLSHRLVQIGVQVNEGWPKASTEPSNGVEQIRLRFERIEGSGLSENVTPEFVDALYGIVKKGWGL